MKKVRVLLLLCLLILCGVGGYYAYAIHSFMNDVQSPSIVNNGTDSAAEAAAEIPVWGGTERVNILLMGVDRRGQQEGVLPRSDSMMVVSIDPVSKKYDLFSVLRDTYVEIPGHGKAKINSALVDGGPELAMETVSEFTGLQVDRYVITDFEGFKGLIDTLGGVQVDVEKAMHYHDPTDKGLYDIDLEKGLQLLNGDQALQYVRFRHDAMSDFTRTERQRKLLGALAEKLKSGTALLQLPDILKSISPYIQTNISSMDMLKLGALGLTLEQSGQYQLPPMGEFREASRGGSVLIPDEDQVQEFVQEKINHLSDNEQTNSQEDTKQAS
ncbi:LCP family protein [Brevibacillus fulvus]|uniref:LCP family protein n=1 Tax=Brevibacillus fulvus TaxID=1125967 RepID=UPI003B82F9C6